MESWPQRFSVGGGLMSQPSLSSSIISFLCWCHSLTRQTGSFFSPMQQKIWQQLVPVSPLRPSSPGAPKGKPWTQTVTDQAWVTRLLWTTCSTQGGLLWLASLGQRQGAMIGSLPQNQVVGVRGAQSPLKEEGLVWGYGCWHMRSSPF